MILLATLAGMAGRGGVSPAMASSAAYRRARASFLPLDADALPDGMQSRRATSVTSALQVMLISRRHSRPTPLMSFRHAASLTMLPLYFGLY